ncbi:hypothetical protein BV22DRAFT_1072737 [Leucogyrophana mollusca]|uniref:Uncharacterized protein n=1 Tax=Leucogyrophana mollusca TaxID=85980 RepID=A0ACB8B6P1_9AGAM|nr:hypothetical protein BV22DRAFT_1072737 [Leucogyrophana mollusca]
MFHKSDRTASLVISLIGTVVNFVIAAQLLGAWRSFRWESESEWEGSEYSLSKNGVSITWALLSAYFAAASAICSFGVVGIVRGIPSFVRIYRNYIIGDFAIGTILTAIWTYAAFQPSVLSNICEQLSRQPDLLHDFLDPTFSLENCEQWAEPGVTAFMAVMVVITIIRLHFLIALSSYYKALVQHRTPGLPQHAPHCAQPAEDEPLQHLYILRPLESDSHSRSASYASDIYVPITYMDNISDREADKLRSRATEIWVPPMGRVHTTRGISSPPVEGDLLHFSNEKSMKPF